jgi:hypothetical protein
VPTALAKRGKGGLVTKATRPRTVLASDKSFFVGHVGDRKVIFKKVQGTLKVFYFLVEQTTYNKRDYFPFEKIISEEAQKHNLEATMMKQLLRAIK